MTKEESIEIIKKYLDPEQIRIMDLRNHKKYSLREDDKTFRFTVKLMSLDFLISLMEDKKIKNVYWNPSTPPPGGSIDSISMRYKVYVEYN